MRRHCPDPSLRSPILGVEKCDRSVTFVKVLPDGGEQNAWECPVLIGEIALLSSLLPRSL